MHIVEAPALVVRCNGGAPCGAVGGEVLGDGVPVRPEFLDARVVHARAVVLAADRGGAAEKCVDLLAQTIEAEVQRGRLARREWTLAVVEQGGADPCRMQREDRFEAVVECREGEPNKPARLGYREHA